MTSRFIVVLLNLKSGKSAADYEAWARTTDLPTVKALPSVTGFEVFRTSGLLGTSTPAPYAYVEVIEIADLDAFFADVSGDRMKAIAAEFQDWADPMFILADRLAPA